MGGQPIAGLPHTERRTIQMENGDAGQSCLIIRAAGLTKFFGLKDGEVPFLHDVVIRAAIDGQAVISFDDLRGEEIKGGTATQFLQHFDYVTTQFNDPVSANEEESMPVRAPVDGFALTAVSGGTGFQDWVTLPIGRAVVRNIIIHRDADADTWNWTFRFSRVPGLLWWPRKNIAEDIFKVRREQSAGQAWYQTSMVAGQEFYQVNPDYRSTG